MIDSIYGIGLLSGMRTFTKAVQSSAVFTHMTKPGKGCLLLSVVCLLCCISCDSEGTPELKPKLERLSSPIIPQDTQATPQNQYSGKWEMDSNNPVLPMGALKAKAFWNDPCVLKKGDEDYVLYMTSSVGEPFQPPVLPFRAVSSDGENWKLQPEEPLLSAEGTDFVSIETPSVIFYKGKYHMYFSGIYKPGSVPAMAIGHAISDDGIQWALVDSGKPVVQATGQAQDWNSYLVAEPGAVVFKDQVYLYFSAVGGRKSGHPPQRQVIGLATSTDGHQFSAPVEVMSQSKRYPAKQGYCGYSTPTALLHGGQIHLYYDVARFDAKAEPQWYQMAIHHAISSDGMAFTQDAEPLFIRGQASWLDSEIRAPSVIKDGNYLKMWFAGHGDMRALIGDLHQGKRSQHFGIGFAKRLAPSN